MSLTDYLSISILIFFAYLLTYALINRICTCFENCAKTKAYGDVMKNNFDIPNDILENLKRSKK